MASDLVTILRDAKRSDRDITGAPKRRGDVFSRSVENKLQFAGRQAVRSIVEETQAEGYRDAVCELELAKGMLRSGAFRLVFGFDPEDLLKEDPDGLMERM